MRGDGGDRPGGGGDEAAALDWREPVLRTIAIFHLLLVPPILAASFLRVSDMFTVLYDGLIAFHLACVVAAIFARRVPLGLRAGALVASLLGGCSYIVWYLGTVPGGMLGLAEATIVVGLLFGGRAGTALLVVSTACFLAFGALGRADIAARISQELGSGAAWARMSVTYFLFTGVILLVIVRSASAVARGLQETRRLLAGAIGEREERERAEVGMGLALDAASASVWSLDAATGALSWLGGAAAPAGPSGEAPATLDAYLASVPEEDQPRVRSAFSEALAGEAEPLRVEHGWSSKEAPPRWVAIRARLHASPAQRERRLLGTFAYASRLEAHGALLRLATSESVRHGDLEEGLREATETAAEILGVERCSVWFLRDEGRALHCVDLWERGPARHSRGMVLSTTTYPSYFAALHEQRFVAADDARTDPRTREFKDDYLVPLGIVSMLDAPIHAAGRLSGVLCHEHVAKTPRRWTAEDQALAGALADCASRVLEAADRAVARRELQRTYEELGQVARRMEAAREEERRHIARELHDELGQALTSIKLDLGMAARASDPGTSAARLEDAGRIVDRALASTRELSVALRPPLLDELGLLPALRGFLEDQSRRSTVALDLEAPASLQRLAWEVEISAFRIVQETVTNALRHAAARRITVQVHARNGRLQLAIRDDGRGFEVEATARRALEGGHLGLVGMRERVRALAGSFVVTSKPGGGTEIAVELPA